MSRYFASGKPSINNDEMFISKNNVKQLTVSTHSDKFTFTF